MAEPITLFEVLQASSNRGDVEDWLKVQNQKTGYVPPKGMLDKWYGADELQVSEVKLNSSGKPTFEYFGDTYDYDQVFKKYKYKMPQEVAKRTRPDDPVVEGELGPQDPMNVFGAPDRPSIPIESEDEDMDFDDMLLSEIEDDKDYKYFLETGVYLSPPEMEDKYEEWEEPSKEITPKNIRFKKEWHESKTYPGLKERYTGPKVTKKALKKQVDATSFNDAGDAIREIGDKLSKKSGIDINDVWSMLKKGSGLEELFS